VALRDGPHQVGGGLEAAAEDEAEGRARCLGREGIECSEDGVAAEASGPEPPVGLAIARGQGPGVGIAEQVEDQGRQAGAPRRLGQGAAGLGGDEEGPAGGGRCRPRRAGRQPATSTARV
jgi:hypothetical protein